MHPTLEPMVKKELDKLFATKIIFPVNHTKWVANMVPIKKKNGERKLWHRFSEFELSFIQGQLLHYAYGKNIAICFGVRMHLL